MLPVLSPPDNISVVALVCKLLEQRRIGLAVLRWRHWAQIKDSSREVATFGKNDSPTLSRVGERDQAL